MPSIKITENLRNFIKTERKKRKIRGDVLAEQIGKSPSYISALENGKISTIDVNLFFTLVENIIDLRGNDLSKYLKEILPSQDFCLSKKEQEDYEWIYTVEYQYRLFPISDEMINFISNFLEELNLDSISLVKEINKNSTLPKEISESLDYNKVVVKCDENGKVLSSIKFKLKDDYIDRILNKKIKTINRINLRGILFNLFILKGNSEYDSLHLTDLKLNDFKIHTLEERKKIVKSSKSEEEIKKNLNPNEYECTEYIKNIIKHLKLFRDMNPGLAKNVLNIFSNNLDNNLNFTLSILNIDITCVNSIEDEEKRELIKKIKNLIKTYSEKDKNNITIFD